MEKPDPKRCQLQTERVQKEVVRGATRTAAGSLKVGFMLSLQGLNAVYRVIKY